MSITIIIVSTTVASALGASIATILLQHYWDRRLEYFFNTRLAERQAMLDAQGDIQSQLAAKRLEVYPHVAELIYRLRNKLGEICRADVMSMAQAVEFLRLAEDYTEQIYAARLYLERDGIFETLHDFKGCVLAAKNALLNWLTASTQADDGHALPAERALAQLAQVNSQIDRQHKHLIKKLTALTTQP